MQNEFDAKGTKIEILLGENSALILGNGRPIDTAGWKSPSTIRADTLPPEGKAPQK